LPPDHADRERAMRLAMSAGASATDQQELNLSALKELAKHQALRMDVVYGAWRGGQLVASGLALESPGRTALVFAGPFGATFDPNAPVVHVLRAMNAHVWLRGSALTQILVEVDDVSAARHAKAADFAYLAELIYLKRPTDLGSRAIQGAADLRYFTYTPEREGDFIAALDASYVGSLDCPRLVGLRASADVLLGHRHTGIHDPALWFIANHDDRPIGVLLMSPVVGQDEVEVVYIGVSPSGRGRGIGDNLLGLAADVARRRGFSALTLAVDSTNIHARRLYDRWGFAEAARRRAWIAVCPSSSIKTAGVSTDFSTR